MITITTMISSYDRPRSHSGLFYQRNLQSQCTTYLPVQLTPKYFGRQIHRKYPLVLWNRELPLHFCFPVAHSFTSVKQEVLLFSLPFFSNINIVVFAHKRNTEKQSSLINSMITDGTDSNLSPVATTDCCSKYGYNSVIGLCPSYIPK